MAVAVVGLYFGDERPRHLEVISGGVFFVSPTAGPKIDCWANRSPTNHLRKLPILPLFHDSLLLSTWTLKQPKLFGLQRRLRKHVSFVREKGFLRCLRKEHKMSRKRPVFSDAFKSNVTLGAHRGLKTTVELVK